ncbi:polysaccharide biosynthesis C-terminal domain-containing protein [Sphingorhabdus contaminans]|uniref:polysaccharide biosynthesis C-terminal domain-containing protein n=1 Tax=Sphingorhabdus contaminans TaxID=1343899 RepID=UPI003D285925
MLQKKFMNQVFALALSGSGTVVLQGTTLLLTIAIANIYGPIGLSQFSVTQTTMATVAGISQFGLGYTALNFVARQRSLMEAETKSIAQFCLGATLLLSSLSALAILCISGTIASYIFGNGILTFFVGLSAIGIPFMALSLVQQSILNGLERYMSIFTLSLVSMIVSFAMVFLGSQIAGLEGAAIGLVASVACRSLLLQFAIHQSLPLFWNWPSLVTWKRIRSFAIPAGLASLSLTPSTWFANAWLIKHAGLETQGLVFAALTVRAAVSLVPQQLSTVLLPRYLKSVEASAKHHRRLMIGYAALFGLTTGLFCIAAYVYRDSVFRFFGEEFYADSTTLFLLLTANIVEALGMPFSLYYARKERMWSYLLTFTYPKDLVLVIASLVFIPVYGGVGIAYAYLVSTVFGFISLAVAQIITYLRRRAAVN